MSPSFSSLRSTAWGSLGLWKHFQPGEEFPRVSKRNFEKLKKDYVDKYGYIIRIPKLGEIFQLTPTEFKTLDDIKREKRAGLMNILASPQPEWAKQYASVMTWMDNIQDATSVVYPAIAMLARWFPKIFGKAIPVLGWLMFGTDLLQWMINMGRTPFTPMKAKRILCKTKLNNPFSITSRMTRANRLRNYKPGWTDMIQVLQVTQSTTGFGLGLGCLMGAIQDSIFGAYRYITGERVRILMDVPDMFEHEKYAAQGLNAGAILSSTGQTFSDMQHFQWYTFTAVCARLVAPVYHNTDPLSLVENPMDLMIPAPAPTNPITLDVIREAGLSVEDGIGWPFNGQREMRLDDLSDAIAPKIQDHYTDFLFRHSNDWYGFVAATTLMQVTPALIHAASPDADMEFDDTDEWKVAFRMIKAGLLPKEMPSQDTSEKFLKWIKDYSEINEHPPGLLALKEKMDLMRIPYRESYPTTREPGADEIWPEGLESWDLDDPEFG